MDLVTYYAKRAAEYEAIYQKPERQSDLRELENLLRRDFAGRNVLEIACGTGYWTERVASVADSIVALDINESVLEIGFSDEACLNQALTDFLTHPGPLTELT